ncbi:MAG: methylated-DNA--[protein]-cysteine S-methyltransferase [Thermoleophilaceae bacterium]
MMQRLVVESPLGPLVLRGDHDALVGLAFARRGAAYGGDEGGVAGDAARRLSEYFAGSRSGFELPLRFERGSAFERRVWNALLEIPYGATTTYGELATALGEPGAARAVGAANGRNPIAIIVPCHRVIGAGGRLTGYGGGLPRKRALLALEGAAAADASRSPQLSF